MKINSVVQTFCAMSALFCPFSGSFSYADSETFETSIVSNSDIDQRPEIPSNMDVRDLPSSARASNRSSATCFASYMIEKFGDPQSSGSNELRYHVRVTNLGDCPLHHVAVTDFFPAHTTLQSVYPTPNWVGVDRARWVVNQIPVGEAFRIRIRFSVKPQYGSRWVTNNACAWNEMIGQRICGWASTWYQPQISQ